MAALNSSEMTTKRRIEQAALPAVQVNAGHGRQYEIVSARWVDYICCQPERQQVILQFNVVALLYVPDSLARTVLSTL